MRELIFVQSSRSVRETADILVKLIEGHGLRVFGRIDHGTNAKDVGLELRPTELLLFGNPKGGTPLMQDKQTVGLDLPFKVLVWEDKDSKVWLTYNDPEDLVERHNLGLATSTTIETMKTGVAKLVMAACEAALLPQKK